MIWTNSYLLHHESINETEGKTTELHKAHYYLCGAALQFLVLHWL